MRGSFYPIPVRIVAALVCMLVVESCAVSMHKPYWRDREPEYSYQTEITGIYYTATYVDPELKDVSTLTPQRAKHLANLLATRFPNSTEVHEIAPDRLTVAAYFRCGTRKIPCSEKESPWHLIGEIATLVTLGIIPHWREVGSTFVFVIHHNGKRFGPYTYELEWTFISSIAMLFFHRPVENPKLDDEVIVISKQFAVDTKTLMTELLAQKPR